MNDAPVILDLNDPSWLTFVESRPEATPFHHPSWTSLIAESYRLDGFVFALRSADGEIVAGLPITDVGRRRRWVSTAFTDYCGPLAADEARGRLLAALEDKRRRDDLRSIEIRADVGGPARPQTVGFRHRLALDADATDTLKRLNYSQVQRSIRKAEREGVRVRHAMIREDLDVFYSLHLATRRRLGVPIQPRAFFDALWRWMVEPGLARMFIAEIEGTPVAAGIFLGWRETVVYKFGASDRSTWSHRPNHALFWSAIRWACEEGFEFLDFGRTDRRNEGLRAFKASWGTLESELVYSTLGTPRVARANGVASQALGAVIRHSPEFVCRGLGERLYRLAA